MLFWEVYQGKVADQERQCSKQVNVTVYSTIAWTKINIIYLITKCERFLTGVHPSSNRMSYPRSKKQ